MHSNIRRAHLCSELRFGLGTHMYFELVGPIAEIERIAMRNSIRDLARLREQYGGVRWRKLKGIATVRLGNGRIRRVELHWYEALGVGKGR